MANIPPEIRSTLRAINLFAVVKTPVIKIFSIQKILEPFVQEITKLQTEEIDITVNNVVKNYESLLLFVTSDTPASALMGGFKESVSASRSCRTCLTTKTQLQTNFSESNFILRDANSHREHLQVILEPSLPKKLTEY